MGRAGEEVMDCVLLPLTLRTIGVRDRADAVEVVIEGGAVVGAELRESGSMGTGERLLKRRYCRGRDTEDFVVLQCCNGLRDRC